MRYYERTGAAYLPAVLSGGVKLNGLRRAQVSAWCGGGDAVDAARIRAFLDTLWYPLYFLDFETVQPAVPMWDGCRCYQQVPTQFLLHWIERPGGALHHAEYLAPSTGDPRRGVGEALVSAIPEGACTTAYNMSFEKGRIKELAAACPNLSERLMAIREDVRDLMVPFQSGWAYLEAMEGSYSIKKVLPAVCPGDPELDYRALEGVHNGAEAMDAFARLSSMGPEEEARTREQLLRYCELDTLAMVKVWQWLEANAAPAGAAR